MASVTVLPSPCVMALVTKSLVSRRGRGLVGGRALAAAVGVIPAQGFAVARGGLPQSLRYPPDTHGTDGYSKQQPRQTRREWIWRHGSQQCQQPGEGTADAPWFHAQQIQHRTAFEIATRHPNSEAPETRPPRNRPHVLADHDSLAKSAPRAYNIIRSLCFNAPED